MWDAGVITQQPGEITEGVKTYTCTVCRTTRTEIIPATGVKSPEADEAVKKTPAAGTKLTDSATKAVYKVLSPGAADGSFDGTVEYMKPTNASAKTVNIPASVTIGGITYKVTAIRAKAFYKCTKMTMITIPSSVQQIGKQAFMAVKS